MKAPDKIYVKDFPDMGITATWYHEARESENFTNIEYIRKDALLELVRSAYGKVSMNPFDCSEAFDELINKIKTL